MSMKLTFLGAAQTVTGSRYLLEAGGKRLLIDCGLYQERDLKNRNWDPFPISPSSIDAVLLTHAHIDHCGYLPRLVHDGFQGPVFGTFPTGEIAKIVLMDSAKLQAEDASLKRRRHDKENRQAPHPEQPLYGPEDVEACCSRFQSVAYKQTFSIGDAIRVTYFDAGHILGSASIRVEADQSSILFSGDIGRWDRPIIEDPEFCPPTRYVVMESTYGDRDHEQTGLIADHLAAIITDTHKRGGNLIIPTFAIERAQEVLYYLNNLLLANRIPHIMVFVDSPMAASVTRVFEKHLDMMDADMQQLIQKHQSPFHFPSLKMTATVDDSKAINHISGTVAIMAGAGMCTGGRVKHHLANNISKPSATVLFVGYQAVGTLGRIILDGVTPVRILGQSYPVRARITQIPGFSAHADRGELIKWLSRLTTPPRHVFVTHGEPAASRAFAATLKELRGFNTSVPAYNDTVTLD
jgi:metallo-beta-lactamase family protein